MNGSEHIRLTTVRASICRCDALTSIEQLNPCQSFWYNKTKIRHSINTVKTRTFLPVLVSRQIEADVEASRPQGQAVSGQSQGVGREVEGWSSSLNLCLGLLPS
jgi:hypothetical protein